MQRFYLEISELVQDLELYLPMVKKETYKKLFVYPFIYFLLSHINLQMQQFLNIQIIYNIKSKGRVQMQYGKELAEDHLGLVTRPLTQFFLSLLCCISYVFMLGIIAGRCWYKKDQKKNTPFSYESNLDFILLFKSDRFSTPFRLSIKKSFQKA